MKDSNLGEKWTGEYSKLYRLLKLIRSLLESTPGREVVVVVLVLALALGAAMATDLETAECTLGSKLKRGSFTGTCEEDNKRRTGD